MSDNNITNYSEINRQLFEKYKNGNYDVRNQIVEVNLNIAKKLANRYSNVSNISYEDLVQTACLALTEAVDNYDLSLGIQFSTYAISCITGKIKHYIRGNYYPFHILYKLRDEFITYKRLSDMNLSKREISDKMNISLDELDKIINEYNEIKKSNNILSLNAKLNEDDDKSLTIEDSIGVDSDSHIAIDSVFREELLQQMSKILTEKEMQVICMRYGFNSNEMTQAEVARALGVSRKNISSKEKNALKKLALRDSFKKFYECI